MKISKAISVLVFCLIFLFSCGKENWENKIINDDRWAITVEESITPMSVMINTRGSYSNTITFLSENKETLESVMNNYRKYSVSPPSGVIRTKNYHKSEIAMFDGLKPATTYYYLVAFEDTPIRLSSIHAIEMEDIKDKVDMGGSVEWCGFNFISDRGKWSRSEQLLKTSLFSSEELPTPDREILDGDWRYPTIDELQELCDNCTVTMVDYENHFVRLTSKNGNNLYIPYTLEKPLTFKLHGYKQLMLFPCDDKVHGLYVSTTSDTPSIEDILNMDYEPYVWYGKAVNNYNISICSVREDRDFFNWGYIDGVVDPPQYVSGTEKRGVRFVVDK